MIVMRYAVVIEQGEHGYGAYAPDLPGVISVGESEELTRRQRIEERLRAGLLRDSTRSNDWPPSGCPHHQLRYRLKKAMALVQESRVATAFSPSVCCAR